MKLTTLSALLPRPLILGQMGCHEAPRSHRPSRQGSSYEDSVASKDQGRMFPVEVPPTGVSRPSAL